VVDETKLSREQAEKKEAIKDIIERYLNHRLVYGIMDEISDRFAEIDNCLASVGEYGNLADEIERRILAMFDNEEPHKFYDDTVLPFVREQLGSKKAMRFKKETDEEITKRVIEKGAEENRRSKKYWHFKYVLDWLNQQE